jgi:hypothetical protein
MPGMRRANPPLECAGYAPMRTSDRGSRGKFAHKSVGSAIFVNSEKLEVLSSKRVYLRDFVPMQGNQSVNISESTHFLYSI